MSVIYLDMDGVLANFFEKWAEHFGKKHWKDIPNKQAAAAELKGTDFFYTLLPFEKTQELVYHVRTVAEENNLSWVKEINLTLLTMTLHPTTANGHGTSLKSQFSV